MQRGARETCARARACEGGGVATNDGEAMVPKEACEGPRTAAEEATVLAADDVAAKLRERRSTRGSAGEAALGGWCGLSLEVLVGAPPLVLELVGQHVRWVLGDALAEGEGRHQWALLSRFIAHDEGRDSLRSIMRPDI